MGSISIAHRDPPTWLFLRGIPDPESLFTRNTQHLADYLSNSVDRTCAVVWHRRRQAGGKQSSRNVLVVE